MAEVCPGIYISVYPQCPSLDKKIVFIDTTRKHFSDEYMGMDDLSIIWYYLRSLSSYDSIPDFIETVYRIMKDGYKPCIWYRSTSATINIISFILQHLILGKPIIKEMRNGYLSCCIPRYKDGEEEGCMYVSYKRLEHAIHICKERGLFVENRKIEK